MQSNDQANFTSAVQHINLLGCENASTSFTPLRAESDMTETALKRRIVQQQPDDNSEADNVDVPRKLSCSSFEHENKIASTPRPSDVPVADATMDSSVDEISPASAADAASTSVCARLTMNNGDRVFGGTYSHGQLMVQAEQLAPNEIIDKPRTNHLIEELILQLVQEDESEQYNWATVFSKIQRYELSNPARLDELIAEAKQLERNLLREKEQLKQKLGVLSSLLNTNQHSGHLV